MLFLKNCNLMLMSTLIILVYNKVHTDATKNLIKYIQLKMLTLKNYRSSLEFYKRFKN